MGGRGSSGSSRGPSVSGGIKLPETQYKKIEDNAQFKDAIFYGYTRGAKQVEYTDSTGEIRKAETGRQNGGTYRTSYSDKVEKYSRMSTRELQKELKKQQGISDNNYQMFTRQAASKSASLIRETANADVEIKAIKQVLRRRKNN